VTEHASSEAATASAEPSAAEFLARVAGSDWEDIDLAYAATNVLYARGSLGRETRRTACSAIRTLQAILKDARQLKAADLYPRGE
jgi:hypothetical protein